MHARMHALCVQVTQREQKCRGVNFAGSRTRMWFTKPRFNAEAVWLQSSCHVRRFDVDPSPLPFLFPLSLPSRIPRCVELRCSPSVAHSCHHVPESDFKGLNDQKISTEEKNIAVQLQGEVLCAGHTGAEVFREPSWGKIKTTERKKKNVFIWSSSMRDRLHNTSVTGCTDDNGNKAEANKVRVMCFVLSLLFLFFLFF